MAITVLQKPASIRLGNDIKMLMKATRDVKFFSEISKQNGIETYEACCRHMYYKFYREGDVIFSAGRPIIIT